MRRAGPLDTTAPMRLALSLLVVALCSCTSSRDLPPEQRQVQAVHAVDGLTRDVIYQRAAVWFAKSFHDSKAVMQVQEPASGTLIGKGVIPGAFHRLGAHFDLGVTITVEAKDGRYRSTFDDYELISQGTRREVYVDSGELDQALEACRALDAELAAAVLAKAKDF